MSRRRLRVSLSASLLGIGVLAIAAQPGALGSTPGVQAGGVFRVSLAGLDYIDPALSYSSNGWALLDTTCARLMAYPDKPPPAGFSLEPEVAAGYPKLSHDGKTYTFSLRSGYRFSDGTPVRADAFARAINRTLAPGVTSPGAQYTRFIAGAADVQAGKAPAAVGVVARGNTLVVRFTHPVLDFPAQTTMPFFCAVPPGLPADPEGVGAFPGAGPYYVSEYRRGERVVIQRNRFYGGRRPHYVDSFVVDLQADSEDEVVDHVERGEADWGLASPPSYLSPGRGLVAKYGINRSQFFIKPGLSFVGWALNASRPLFRNNIRLNKAVNLAFDRRAIRATAGGPLASQLTDQYLPPSLPGFTNARIYPVDQPNLSRARALARDRTRGGKAVLYAPSLPFVLSQAQIIKLGLAKIGLDVEIKPIPPPAFQGRVKSPGEPYDIALDGWTPDYIDPYAYINILLDGRFAGGRGQNLAQFDSPKYNNLMRRAARLQGPARYLAYGKLDVQLARDAAPLVAVSYRNEFTLVSKRVGCIVLRPALDLTAACLK